MRSGGTLVAAACSAEVLTMLGVFAFPALLPTFMAEWRLSNTEAGWIAGIYFAAYALGVPVLVALTDRLDARLIYIGGALLAAVASAGFALFAEGFWSALGLRALAGLALAGTYMPGLRVLVDRYEGPQPSRAVAFYTSSFSLGTAASFLFAGEIASALGWRPAFIAAALAAAAAALVVLMLRPVRQTGLEPVTPEQPPSKNREPKNRELLLDFRPVFANPPAMGYILGYGVHCWELFTLRSWMVAFLAFSLTLQPDAATAIAAPTTIAMVSGLIAMAASIASNELCMRFGRRRVIRLVMVLSAASAAAFGFAAGLPYAAVAGLALVYSALVQLDSAALTAGAVAVAEPGRQGATIAVHSLIGFGSGFVGPLVLGWTLDMTGGAAPTVSWGFAFATVAVVGVLGPIALLLVPKDGPMPPGGVTPYPADARRDARRRDARHRPPCNAASSPAKHVPKAPGWS
jgi:MFS family permease